MRAWRGGKRGGWVGEGRGGAGAVRGRAAAAPAPPPPPAPRPRPRPRPATPQPQESRFVDRTISELSKTWRHELDDVEEMSGSLMTFGWVRDYEETRAGGTEFHGAPSERAKFAAKEYIELTGKGETGL